MNAHTPDEQTRIAWNVFKRLTDAELDTMLETAGVRPCNDRSLKLQQAVTVWFHGDVPNLSTIAELANKPLGPELPVDKKVNEGGYMTFL